MFITGSILMPRMCTASSPEHGGSLSQGCAVEGPSNSDKAYFQTTTCRGVQEFVNMSRARWLAVRLYAHDCVSPVKHAGFDGL